MVKSTPHKKATTSPGPGENMASISLGGSQGSSLTVGRNKSGMPWKKSSGVSSFKVRRVLPKTYVKRMEEAKVAKALQ